MSLSLFPYILAAIALLLMYRWAFSRKLTGLPLPPGPQSLPFLGNVGDIDLARPWRTYSEWKKKYGQYCDFKHLPLSHLE